MKIPMEYSEEHSSVTKRACKPLPATLQCMSVVAWLSHTHQALGQTDTYLCPATVCNTRFKTGSRAHERHQTATD